MVDFLQNLLGPICVREMVVTGRRLRYFVNRLLYGAALLVGLWIVYQNNRSYFGAWGEISSHVASRVGYDLFVAVSVVQTGAVLLFVPLFFCGVIATEREDRTLDLLLTTSLSDREIVLGKVVSRLALMLFLVLSGLPVLALAMFLGGIDPASLALVTAGTLMLALFTAAHSVYFSAATKGPFTALMRTYLWLALLLLVIPAGICLIFVMVANDSLLASNPVLIQLSFFHPLAPIVVALNDKAWDSAVYSLGHWFFMFTLIAPTLWSVFLLWRTVKRLRQEPVAGQLRRPRTEDEERPLRQGAVTSQTQKRVHTGVENPFWQRARNLQAFGRGSMRRAVVSLAAWIIIFIILFLTWLADTRALHDPHTWAELSKVVWVVVGTLTALFAGTSLVGDRQRGFLEHVLVTPLTGKEIVNGTLLAVWEIVRLVFWLPWVVGLASCLFSSISFFDVLFSSFTGTLACLMIALYGVGCSLAAKTMAGGAASAFVFPVTVTIIPALQSDSGMYCFFLTVVILSLALFPVFRNMIERHLNLAGVAFLMMDIHLAIVFILLLCSMCLFVLDFQSSLVISPIFWIGNLLESGEGVRYEALNLFALLLYWVACFFTVFCWHGWVIRHFDALAGRTATR